MGHMSHVHGAPLITAGLAHNSIACGTGFFVMHWMCATGSAAALLDHSQHAGPLGLTTQLTLFKNQNSPN